MTRRYLGIDNIAAIIPVIISAYETLTTSSSLITPILQGVPARLGNQAATSRPLRNLIAVIGVIIVVVGP